VDPGGRGWIELGRDECGSSLIRVLNIDGMLWEGDEVHNSVSEAMDEAKEFIGQ